MCDKNLNSSQRLGLEFKSYDLFGAMTFFSVSRSINVTCKRNSRDVTRALPVCPCAHELRFESQTIRRKLSVRYFRNELRHRAEGQVTHTHTHTWSDPIQRQRESLIRLLSRKKNWFKWKSLMSCDESTIIHLFIHPLINQLTFFYLHPSSVHPFICLFIPLSICPLIHLFFVYLILI